MRGRAGTKDARTGEDASAKPAKRARTSLEQATTKALELKKEMAMVLMQAKLLKQAMREPEWAWAKGHEASRLDVALQELEAATTPFVAQFTPTPLASFKKLYKDNLSGLEEELARMNANVPARINEAAQQTRRLLAMRQAGQTSAA